VVGVTESDPNPKGAVAEVFEVEEDEDGEDSVRQEEEETEVRSLMEKGREGTREDEEETKVGKWTNPATMMRPTAQWKILLSSLEISSMKDRSRPAKNTAKG